jgi:hypothetical protein
MHSKLGNLDDFGLACRSIIMKDITGVTDYSSSPATEEEMK